MLDRLVLLGTGIRPGVDHADSRRQRPAVPGIGPIRADDRGPGRDLPPVAARGVPSTSLLDITPDCHHFRRRSRPVAAHSSRVCRLAATPLPRRTLLGPGVLKCRGYDERAGDARAGRFYATSGAERRRYSMYHQEDPPTRITGILDRPRGPGSIWIIIKKRGGPDSCPDRPFSIRPPVHVRPCHAGTTGDPDSTYFAALGQGDEAGRPCPSGRRPPARRTWRPGPGTP